MKKLLCIALLLGFYSGFASAQATKRLEKMEPTFWWVGMENPEVQVLVYGKGIGAFTPSIAYAGVDLLNVIKIENPNYLFLMLRINPSAKAGFLPILFANGKVKFTQDYELKERRQNARLKPTLTSADVVYLIMPDRFANGETTNDVVAGYYDKLGRKDSNGRHGGDLAGIIQHLDYLKELGVTAIWLTPVLDNNIKGISYHGYSITDHYKVDARFGTNEDYLLLVNEAHKRGIKIVLDVVFNQMGFEHFTNLDKPCHDWINEWPEYTSSNFKGSCMPDIHASKYDVDRMIKGWFTPVMPDFNQQNPLVETYLKQFVTWWVEYSNLDAIRFDTYQFNDKLMVARWAKELRIEYPGISTFVEVWDGSPALVSSWQENGSDRNYQSYIQSPVDFPLAYGIQNAMSGSIDRVYDVVAQDFLYYNPNANVTFFTNHDFDRPYSIFNEDLEKMKMSTAILLTTRGIPQLYYADELLYTGIKDSTGDGPRRKDFLGGFPNDSINCFEAAGRKGKVADYFNYLQKLLNWRKANSDLMAGKLVHFIPSNELYIYFRITDTRILMVIVNNGKSSQKVDFTHYNEIIKNRISGVNVVTDKKELLDSNFSIDKKCVQIIELK